MTDIQLSSYRTPLQWYSKYLVVLAWKDYIVEHEDSWQYSLVTYQSTTASIVASFL